MNDNLAKLRALTSHVTLYFTAAAGASRGDWQSLDGLNLRLIDDRPFAPDEVLETFASPPDTDPANLVALPTQIALERFVHHLNRPALLRISAAGEAQQLTRLECVILIGLLQSTGRKRKQNVSSAEALRKDDPYVAVVRAFDEDAAQDSRIIALCELGLPEQALEFYELYVEAGNENQLLEAVLRNYLGHYGRSREIAEKIIAENNLAGSAFRELGRALLGGKEYGRALDAFNAALTNDPDCFRSKLLKGTTLRALGADGKEPALLEQAVLMLREVSTLGGFHASAALFHEAACLLQLGHLETALATFKNSLTMKDSVGARDGLGRALLISGSHREAGREAELLEHLDPRAGAKLREFVDQNRPAIEVRDESLWSGSFEERLAAAHRFLQPLPLHLDARLTDFCVWDDFVNYMAPEGELLTELLPAALADVRREDLGAAVAVHLAGLLKNFGWKVAKEGVEVIASRGDYRLRLVHSVRERLLLGTGADNATSLASLIGASEDFLEQYASYTNPFPREAASAAAIGKYREHAQRGTAFLAKYGLSDPEILPILPGIDDLLDRLFQPGGESTDASVDFDETWETLGFCFGEAIARLTGAEWTTHPLSVSGISVRDQTLGELFPLSAVRRRLFLGKAADYATRLSGLGPAIALAHVLSSKESKGADVKVWATARLERLLPWVPPAEQAQLVEIAVAAIKEQR